MAVALAGAAGYWLTVLRPAGRDARIAAALEARKFDEARKLIDGALAADPANVELLLLAARTARRANDADAASNYRARFLRAGGAAAEAEFEAILQRNQDGDISGAAAALRLCERQPDHPHAALILEAVTRGYLHQRPVSALAAVEVWLNREPGPTERAYALFLRGQARERTGDGPGAAKDYRASLDANPDDDECRFRFADVIVRDDPREAIGHFQSLLARDPTRVDFRLGAARCRRAMGELDAAGTALAELIAAHPDDVAVLTELGKWHLDRREAVDAERRLRRAIELRPTARDANVQLARCLESQGRESEAAAQWAVVRRIDDALFAPRPRSESPP